MRALVLLGALSALALLSAASASAAFEQTGTFAQSGEEVQLGGVGGMAVNVSGAGGVTPGTVYAAAGGNGETRVAMFKPTAGGGLIFSQAWNVTNFAGPYERCGPEGEPAHPHCSILVGGAAAIDLEVDQTTGNVYVIDLRQEAPAKKYIVEYGADGGEEITRFGEMASAGETIAESPGKIHESPYPGAIAVDGAGNVYVFDVINSGNFEHRLMVFRPQTPGDYEHYVYAGAENDIGAGEGKFPARPVTDTAGNVYVAGAGDVEEYDPTHPSDPPVCSFAYAKSGITAMTVDPETGKPFFYTSQDRKVHGLSACEAGEFHELGSFGITPTRGNPYALAFDPARQLEASRAPGVLYAGVPEPNFEPTKNSLGYIFGHVEEVAPSVEAQSLTNVGSTTATLAAQINPRGSQAHYAFQYITAAAYQANEPAERFAGATQAPLGGALLEGNGQEAIGVSIGLSGLLPDTEYRFRALATSHCSSEDPEKLCSEGGTAQAFRTFPAQAPGLPDARAWELVSPPDKHGGQVLPADPTVSSCGELECKPGSAYQHFPMQSAPDGDAIVYEGTPFSPTEGAVIENSYLARRDPKAGWQSANLTPALLNSKAGQGYKAFNAALTQGLFEQTSPSLSPQAPSEYTNLYNQPTASPKSLSPLLLSEPPNRLPGRGAGSLTLAYAGASADLSRLFFAANDALTEETPFAPEALDGGESENNLYEWSGGQLRLVNVLPDNAETIPAASFGAASAHAISQDGSRAFWSDEAGRLYVRENAESTKAIPDPGKFLAASADGSRVLLDDGHVYDLETEATFDLTNGEAGFEGILGQSEDLSQLYFVDTAALTGEEENHHGAKAQAGKDNLYARDQGSTAYLATLLPEDNHNSGSGGDWQASPARRTAEASPGGRWLAFVSQARLTGFDNTGPSSGSCRANALSPPEGPCNEVFLYDAATGDLTCPSCNPSGERPLGSSTLRRIFDEAGDLPQPRYLTDEGRLYFDSQDSLVPADTNNGVEDVYQYEPEGIGSCKREAGCVSLISAGREPIDSNLLAIDEDGSSIFFTSRDQLVLKDKDQLIDLYVAREGAPPPSETEVGRGECQGEACQPPLNPPNDPTPGSSSFHGAGNVEEPEAKPCPRGKVKKHGKCVKKHKAKKHHKQASHNAGGHR